jgi:hypothetical protein
MIDEAITIEQELAELNRLTSELNEEVEKTFIETEIINSAIEAKLQISKIKKSLLLYPDLKSEEYLNPAQTPNKDSYGITGEIISHHNPSITALSFNLYQFYKIYDPIFETNSKAKDHLYFQNRIVYRNGNSPKIWAIAGLTAMKSQIEIQEHLHLKDKILKTPPE